MTLINHAPCNLDGLDKTARDGSAACNMTIPYTHTSRDQRDYLCPDISVSCGRRLLSSLLVAYQRRLK